MAKRSHSFSNSSSENARQVLSDGTSEPSLPVAQLKRIVSSYLLMGDVAQHSNATTTARRDLLAKLIWFLENKNLDECDRHALVSFLSYVRHGHEEPGGRWGNPRMTRPTKPRTAKNYHSILRAFFSWCVEDGLISSSPMERIPVPIDRPDQIRPLSDEQLLKLLGAAKRTTHPKRDEAIVLLLLDTGMRASELVSLKVKDIDLHGGVASVQGKGRKMRHLPFSRDVKRMLFLYMSEEERSPEDVLFLGDRGTGAGEPMSRHALRFLIGRLARAAGIDGVRCSPHSIRHTFAINFLRAGGNQFSLQTLLGHNNVSMTARYVLLAQADLEDQHRRFSPVAQLKGRQPR